MGNYGDEARANEAKRAAAARKWGTMLPAAGTAIGGVGGAIAGGVAGGLATGGAGILPGAAAGGGLGAMLGGGAGQLGGMALTSYADDIDAKREEEKLKRIQNQERAFSMLSPYLQR